MKGRSTGILLAATLAGCGVAGNMPALVQGQGTAASLIHGQAIPGELIVQLKPGSRAALGPVAGTLDLGDAGKFILLKSAPGALNTLDTLKANPDVIGASPNRYVKLPVEAARPNVPALLAPESSDPLYSKQWYLPQIGTDRAWGATRGRGVVVAVVDTGVDYNHPDLKANMTGTGHSFVTNTDDGIDVFGHGTHVAGIAAAAFNNGEGVAGVAPEAKILPVGVLGAEGGGSLFAIANGIKYAADYGVKTNSHVVVNLSLGGPATFDPVSKAAGWYATKKGALLVAAAGNSNTAVGTPARITEYFMAVSATDQANGKASFSNFGKEIAVGAPGVEIMNTTPTYKCPLNDHGYALNYAALRGTSMATPVVAGVAALVWSIHPDWTWQQVRDHVRKTSRDLGEPGHDNVYGDGLVQAGAAVGR